MAGKWQRIHPVCDVADCVNCEDGLCGILDRTDFTGECRFYRARKPVPALVEKEEEPEEKPPMSFVEGHKARIQKMWR